MTGKRESARPAGQKVQYLASNLYFQAPNFVVSRSQIMCIGRFRRKSVLFSVTFSLFRFTSCRHNPNCPKYQRNVCHDQSTRRVHVLYLPTQIKVFHDLQLIGSFSRGAERISVFYCAYLSDHKYHLPRSTRCKEPKLVVPTQKDYRRYPFRIRNTGIYPIRLDNEPLLQKSSPSCLRNVQIREFTMST